MWWFIYHKCEHGDQKAWKAFKSCQPSLQKMIFKNKFTNLFHYFKFGLFEVKSFKKLVSIEKPYLGFFLSVYQAEEKAAVVHFDSFLLWTPFVSDPGLYSFLEHFDWGLFSLWSGLSLVTRFSLIRIWNLVFPLFLLSLLVCVQVILSFLWCLIFFISLD